MQSKKVKEIKYYLEQSACMYGNTQKQALTLINELESENERLTEEKDLYKNQFNELEPRFFDLREENQKLKQDLKKSIDMQKEMIDGFKIAQKEVEENLAKEIPNLFKQFAERLKEKTRVIVSYYSDHADKSFNGISEKEIEETLKEFLK